MVDVDVEGAAGAIDRLVVLECEIVNLNVADVVVAVDVVAAWIVAESVRHFEQIRQWNA